LVAAAAGRGCDRVYVSNFPVGEAELSKANDKTKSKKPPNAGKGRKAGVPNKTTALLKDAILKAADGAGGKDGLIGYLQIQAVSNPGPFMGLLGKVLPMQVSGDPDNPAALNHRVIIEFVEGN
jgi:hypothetical protein